MESQLFSGNTVAGIFAIAAVVIFLFIVILDRLGFKFVREKKIKEEDKSEKIIFEKPECPAHKHFTECLTGIKRQQTINVETLKHHDKELNEGKVDFDKIYKKLEEMEASIAQLCKDVAVIAYALKINHLQEG